MAVSQGILASRLTTDRTIMDLSEIRQHYPAISAAANDLLVLLGPGFTNTADAHVETGISAAASLAGLSILRNKGFDLGGFSPGSMILTDVDADMDRIWNFMTSAAADMGLDPSGGWDLEIPKEHRPLYSIPEMTHKTEKDFLAICARHNLAKEFFPYVAVLAALKLVVAADRLNLLDQNNGKALTGHHVVAGAKTVPLPP